MAAPPRRRASPPVLPDELVEEILLRLPPDDPACLLRASLVCKDWAGIVSHPAFRRRLHELHRAPPVLGFLHDWDDERIPHFVSTTASSFSLAAPDRRFWRAVDCRHGRAIFLSKGWEDTNELLLWEPITGTQQRIPIPAAFEMTASTASSTIGVTYTTAAVVCAADGCDHQGCHGGPFCVLLVSTASILSAYGPFDDFVTSACLYSSETGAWGELTSMHDEFMMDFTYFSSVLVGRSLLYFLSDGGLILEYDLASHGLAVLSTPPESFRHSEGLNLMLAQDGGLALIEALSPDLKLWEREASHGTDAQWVLSQVICLDFLLPAIVGPRDSVLVLGFAEGANTIFVNTLDNLFMIELQSEQVKKVCDGRGFCNLIPVVSFYTPHSRVQVPGDENHDPALQLNLLNGGQHVGWEKKSLELAEELFDNGCKAIKEKNFANAVDCFSHALEIRVRHYGGLALECASTFSRYGCALLGKAREATNLPANVSKRTPNEESIKITHTASTSKDDAGSLEASSSSVEHVLPTGKGGYEEGANLNGKDRKDENMAGDGDDSDLNLAWKMLDTARVIVAKGPENTMEKCTIFYALAEVAMKREDRDNSIGYYFKALAILEHLVRPDHIRIAELNFRICLAFELASKVGDAIPYCAKAISLCKSRIQNLKNAKEALLSDKDVCTSAAEGRSGNFTSENEILSLSRLLARLQKKLGELQQVLAVPSAGVDTTVKRVLSRASHKQNASNTVARAAFSTSQMAGSNNSFRSPTMSTAATTGGIGSGVIDFGIVSTGMEQANDKPISDEPSPKRFAADDSPSVNEM